MNRTKYQRGLCTRYGCKNIGTTILNETLRLCEFHWNQYQQNREKHLIPLTQGQVAIVDDEVYEHLSQSSWCAVYHPRTKSFYAMRNRSPRWMHRAVMEYYGFDLSELGVDHINHDTLDNRLSNLRPATAQQNMENLRNNTSGYPGVYWDKSTQKWKVRISFQGKRQYLGCFESKEDAASARQAFKNAHNIA